MALFDQVEQTNGQVSSADPYLDDLEKVTFSIDGQTRDYVGGSFRGIPFFVSNHELTTGRRIVIDNLPNADANIIQDLGRRTRGVSFDAYLLGSDVFKQKQQLIDAMEAGGIGDLVHPYFGRFRAYPVELSVSETDTAKRFCKVSLSFAIVNDRVTNKPPKNRRAAVVRSAISARDEVAKEMAKSWNVAGQARWVVATAEDAAGRAVDAIWDARQSMRDVAEYAERIRHIREDLSVLVLSGTDLASGLLDLLTMRPPSGYDDPGGAQMEAITAAGWSMAQRPTSSASGSTSEQNVQSLVTLIQVGAASVASELVPEVDYASVQDAENAIESLSDIWDTALEGVTSDTVYYAATASRAAAVEYVAEVSRDLRTMETIRITQSTTALTLTYDLYSDIAELQNIIARNNIRDPFFIPVGARLEVLAGEVA